MAQFDVYKNPRGGTYPLVCDVQAELLQQLDTRVVVPLVLRDKYKTAPIGRAIPSATIDGAEYVIVVPLLAAIPKAALGKPIASLAAHRVDVIAAIDLLITGS